MNRLHGTALVTALCLVATPATAEAASSESATATTIVQGDVLIVRGTGPERRVTSPASTVRAMGSEILSGDKLWIVDRQNGEVIGCRLESTINVGERSVRCGSRSLRALSGS